MKEFKKKLFTNIILSAKKYNSTHKKNSKLITFLALGLIVFLSIILYVPDKIITLFMRIWNFIKRKFGVILIGAVCISLAVFIITKVQSFRNNKPTDDNSNTAKIANNEDANSAENTSDIDNTAENIAEDTSSATSISESNDINLSEANADISSDNLKESEENEESEDTNKDTDNLSNKPEESVTSNENSETDAEQNPVDETNDEITDKTNDKSNVETESIEDNHSEGDNIEANKLYPMDEYLTLLKEKYPDSIGWVFFEDGSISYPIMQGEDNQKYLSIGYDGNPSDTGAIFLDFRSAADFSDSNSIIYGHNMKDKTMFGTLRNFRNIPGYYNDHEYFYIVTEEKTYKYQIFAYMDVPNNYVIYDYVGEAAKSFVADAEPVRLKSYMDSEIPVNIDKKVVTLSTCTDKDDLRFVVLGVMVDED